MCVIGLRAWRRALIADATARTGALIPTTGLPTGCRSPKVERVAEDRRRPGTAIGLYLLTDVDVPFEQDGYRDGEHIREWMHHRFIERLQETRRRFLVLSGSRAERVLAAQKAVHSALDRFASPGVSPSG